MNTHQYYKCPEDDTKWGGVGVPSICPICNQEGVLQPPPLQETFSYKIALENKDPLDTVIERSGIKAHLTLREVQDARRYNLKFKKELEAKIKLDKAKISNVESNHPVVKTLEPVEIAAVLIYADALDSIRKCEKKIKEVDEGNADLEQTEKDIAAQVGVAIPKAALEVEKPVDL